MVGSIDPRCETVRGPHWPKKGRVVDWSSRRGSHLGKRFKPPHQQAGHMDASDPIRPQKLLAARGPSTYGSRLKAGTTSRGNRIYCPTPISKARMKLREPTDAIAPAMPAAVIFATISAA